MDRAEFDQELAKYPIVRSAEFRRDWRAGVPASESSAAASSASATSLHSSPTPAKSALSSPPPPAATSTAAAASSPASSNISTSDTSFFTLLTQFLTRYYTPATAEKITASFRRSHDESIRQLSLDEIELLAKSIKTMKEPQQAKGKDNQQTPDQDIVMD